ncbi:transcriptional repressor [Pelagibacteraceae bacterium]|jgi:Fur family iron response transcriptional regulator|nr:transcriptional repressor [Pelagibacteraceae bacterium]MDC3232860.1 transcriptional repressor [Pelagibacteraceae bacterium]|tara:strand:- start:127 stop:543 length:417 start_codon:yes stop_codon:yes gene_type:complete
MNQNMEIVNRLRSSKLRPTKQRIKIAEFLFNREKTFHFTVENLNKIINKKSSLEKISLATIYNTIEAFKKAGHLKEILTNNNTSYFDTNVRSHHHFYDDDTNELTDINFNEIEVSKLPHAPKGKKIKEVEIIISLQKS